MGSIDRTIGLGILFAALAIAAALRIWLSLNDDGNYWPDEIYQSVEPAHRLVFGYGLVAWEFSQGARNWTFPALVAAPLKLAAVLGLTDPRTYLVLLRLVFVGVSLGAPIGTYMLARAYGAKSVAAATGAALVALAAPLIYFAPRGLSENPSATLVVLGFAMALLPRARAMRRALGASLIGLSVLFRLQNVLFAIGIVGIFAARREWRKAAEAASVLALWALFLGVLDRLTWGGWFASVVNYVSFNLDPLKTAIFDKPPAEYYVTVLFTSMLLPIVAMLGLGAFGATRAPGIAFVVVGFIAVHSGIAHKELRFIIPAIPLLGSLASLGAQHLLDDPREHHWAANAVLAICLACGLVSALTFHTLTLRDLGQSGGRIFADDAGQVTVVGPDASAYDIPGPLDRMLIAAGRQTDICGLRVAPVSLVQSGGYSYLHRLVPLYGLDERPDPGYYNYEISYGKPASGELRAAESGFVLVRLRSTCARDPAFYGPAAR